MKTKCKSIYKPRCRYHKPQPSFPGYPSLMVTEFCQINRPFGPARISIRSRSKQLLRLWKGKVLGTNHIAAFISRDFFPKCHFGCILDKVWMHFGHFSELFPKCIPNASEMYQKSIPNSNKNTIFLQNKTTIRPETNQLSSIHCKK